MVFGVKQCKTEVVPGIRLPHRFWHNKNYFGFWKRIPFK